MFVESCDSRGLGCMWGLVTQENVSINKTAPSSKNFRLFEDWPCPFWVSRHLQGFLTYGREPSNGKT